MSYVATVASLFTATLAIVFAAWMIIQVVKSK
jgi:hypothetical protein